MIDFLRFRDIGYVIVILSLFGLWQYERAAHSRILLNIEAANKKLADKAADLAYKLEIEQSKKLTENEEKSIVFIDRIKYVQAPDTACAADERMRIGTDGVRSIIQGGNTPARR